MGRKKNEAKIHMVNFVYNGKRKKFDIFIEAMIHDYLNSSKMPEIQLPDFSVSVCIFFRCLTFSIECGIIFNIVSVRINHIIEI